MAMNESVEKRPKRRISEKGKDFAKDEIYGSYETCLTARSHSSDVKRTLVSQD